MNSTRQHGAPDAARLLIGCGNDSSHCVVALRVAFHQLIGPKYVTEDFSAHRIRVQLGQRIAQATHRLGGQVRKLAGKPQAEFTAFNGGNPRYG